MVRQERINTAVRLKERIESLQEEMVGDILSSGWSRAATYRRKLVTMLGEIELRVIKLRNTQGDVVSPLLDALSIRRRRYSNEVRMVCADMASRLSYNDTKIELERTTGISIPKRTIHSFVQEIGPRLKEANEDVVRGEHPTTMIGDGTAVRSVYPTQNQVRVAITQENNHGTRRLYGLVVNAPWETVPRPDNPYILVSDAEPGLVDGLASNQDDVQLDLVHAVKESLVKLWSEGMPKTQRDEVSTEMKRILFTLVNSVKKHAGMREEYDAIEDRVRTTLEELEKLAGDLASRGYHAASSFISKNARLMVTFAKLVTIGLHVPYTSNTIERLMGEVAKRCKHKWAHWSSRGLENMLWILLTRYVDVETYGAFWRRYIHALPTADRPQYPP